MIYMFYFEVPIFNTHRRHPKNSLLNRFDNAALLDE